MILAAAWSSRRMTAVIAADDAVGRVAPYRVRMRRQLIQGNWLDVALAAAIVAVCEAQVASGTGQSELHGPGWVAILSGLLLGAPLIWRRRYPAAVLLAVFASAVLVSVLGLSQPKQGYIGEIVAALVVLYTIAGHADLRTALGGLVFGSVAVVLVSTGQSSFELLGSLLLLAAPVVVGRVLRSRRRLIDELQSTTRALELSRDENARAAIAAERVRIARELHDLVAHAVSVMIVQAGAAEQVLDAEPERAREPIQAVQESGRQALSELRRLLGMLRPDRPGASSVGPHPTLAEVDPLVDKLRETGLSVELHQSGVPNGLPPGIDQAAFRIVQEALTNVLKHADATVAHVTLSYGVDAIELEVTDDGRGSRSEANGAGHGLLGMRERTTAYGGEFHAGPRHAGGYAVRARLPIPREP
jgi:signal transduction histidine kinase